MAIFDSPREEREDGAAALSLLVTAIVLSLGIVLYMSLPLALASDRKAENRTAADAAALAGADWIRNDLETALTTEGWLGSWEDFEPFVGTGLDSAENYAQRNGGTLIGYTFDASSWESWAKVESPDVRNSGKPVSEARAHLELPDCSSEPADDPTTPPPDEDPAEDPDEDEEPPGRTLHCDGLDIDLLPADDGDATRYDLPEWAISGLVDLMVPKLID